MGNRGLGLASILTLCLLFLRAFDVIQCSWWWVFAPLWLPPAFVLLVLVIIGLAGLVAAGLDYWLNA